MTDLFTCLSISGQQITTVFRLKNDFLLSGYTPKNNPGKYRIPEYKLHFHLGDLDKSKHLPRNIPHKNCRISSLTALQSLIINSTQIQEL
jgi:hypothetical protein